jgi:chromosome segregation ATPase
MAAVSAVVEESLVRGLQQDLDGLREENREIALNLNQTNSDKQALQAENAELREENERLRKELQAMQGKLEKSNSKAKLARAGTTGSAPAPALSFDDQMEELGKEVAAALDEALGADSETVEGARGAARRRSSKATSSVAISAVKAARRAQATWSAELAKLEDQKLEAQRAASIHAAELEEAHAMLRRVRQELTASRRAQQELQLAETRHLEALEQQRQQQQQQQQQQQAAPRAPAVPRPKSRQQASQFAAYMQAKEQAGGGEARAMLMRAVPADAAATRLPALAQAAPAAAASSTSDAASSLRHMTDALSRKWQNHVQQSQAQSTNWNGGPPRRRY